MSADAVKTAPFELDTSGTVYGVFPTGTGTEATRFIAWSELSPFVRGYARMALTDVLYPMKPPGHILPYTSLAPETLQRFIEDCERFQERVIGGNKMGAEELTQAGRHFWIDRQALVYDIQGFPPQTLYLNDAGKVAIREGGAQ